MQGVRNSFIKPVETHTYIHPHQNFRGHITLFSVLKVAIDLSQWLDMQVQLKKSALKQ